jgi:hypothetical protein
MAPGGRTVSAPDGSTWHVGRQWMPWKPRHRGPGVLVAIVFLLFTVVIPLVALAVEIILPVIMLL